MLIEHRAYTLRPGKLDAFWEAQIERGFELMQPVMERLIGYFAARSGPTDQVVHLYRYDGYDDWSVRLLGLYKVAGLQPYFRKARALLLSQENRFLAPAPVPELTPFWGSGRDWLPAHGPLLPRSFGSIIEETTTVFLPGTLPAYWDACRDHGVASGAFAGTSFLGCFYTLVGRSHQVVEYRCFSSLAEREACYTEWRGNPRWQQLAEAVAPVAVSAESKLLAPAPITQMTPVFEPPHAAA